MPRGTKIMLSFVDWPAEDQERWQQALKPTDRFEESSLGAHLAPYNPKSTAGELRAVPWIHLGFPPRSAESSTRGAN